MMRLLTNLGNSDVWDDIGWTFRTRGKFCIRVGAVISGLKRWNGECAPDGTLNPPLQVFDSGEKTNRTISRLSFHILKQSVDQLEQALSQSITEIVCFCTKQKDQKDATQDTDGLFEILSGPIGQAQFPGVCFTKMLIQADPSDYQEMLNFYVGAVGAMEAKPSVVLIAQATPAMGYALSKACADFYPLAPQFYVAWKRGEGVDKSKVKRLSLFSRDSLSMKVQGLRDLLKRGEYLAAQTFLKDSPILLEMVPGLDALVSFLSHRSAYLFDDAVKDLSALESANKILWEMCQPYSLGLDQFVACGAGSRDGLDCMNDAIAYLLFETLQNAMFEFSQGRLYLSIGFFFSFFDAFQTSITGRFILHTRMYYNDASRSYPELDWFVQGEVMPSLKQTVGMDRDHKRKLLSRWRTENNQDDLENAPPREFDGPTPYHLFDWAAHQPTASQKMKTVYHFFHESANNVRKLRKLRNKSPIAHSMDGISKAEIDTAGGGDYLEFLQKVADCLWILLPEGATPSKPYHQIADDVDQYLEQILEKMA
ncbi:MAG: hypothetical protein SPF89_08925 [Sphaerochaetaceae bacterium]|nr:hypothetical protein [Spirochaetales bacterium]MDY5500214.1 hypothetical protein [Sphaerochaetaceae bacterium]